MPFVCFVRNRSPSNAHETAPRVGVTLSLSSVILFSLFFFFYRYHPTHILILSYSDDWRTQYLLTRRARTLVTITAIIAVGQNRRTVLVLPYATRGEAQPIEVIPVDVIFTTANFKSTNRWDIYPTGLG